MFKFSFGNKKPNIKTYATVGIILSTIIAALSQCSGISENNIWDLFDEIQRKYFPQTILNEFVIKDDEKLNRRIKRDVDNAIEKATPEYDRIIAEYDQKYKPKFIQKPIDNSVCYTDECRTLGGEIRICSPWIETCKETDIN